VELGGARWSWEGQMPRMRSRKARSDDMGLGGASGA
jgi:hypothetical protein